MRPSDAGRTKAKGSCLLIRHAAPAIEPARPAAAWPLCDEGRAAARALGASLSLDAVVSSPEPKALQTAAALGAPVAVDGRLREHDPPHRGRGGGLPPPGGGGVPPA